MQNQDINRRALELYTTTYYAMRNVVTRCVCPQSYTCYLYLLAVATQYQSRSVDTILLLICSKSCVPEFPQKSYSFPSHTLPLLVPLHLPLLGNTLRPMGWTTEKKKAGVSSKTELNAKVKKKLGITQIQLL